MTRRTLVVGGTGPSGYAIVERLCARGDEVSIFHTGRHEVPFSGAVEHIHGNPREEADLRRLLQGRGFDAVVSTSGRVRHVVSVLRGRTRKFVAISGLPYYCGAIVAPGEIGLPLPIRETDPGVTDPQDRYGYLVGLGEDTVMRAHARGDFDATILRYTFVYGRYSYIPFEWFLVRRVLDGRRAIALESDGMMVPQRGYAKNLAQAAMLAIDHPAASGKAYNVGDERSLSLLALTRLVARALDHAWETVPVPLRMSPCRNPFAMRQNTLFDLSAIRNDLGYCDMVPVEEATRQYVLWLRDHPVTRGGPEERALGPQAFDYATEDRVIERCRAFYGTPHGFRMPQASHRT